MQNPMTSGSHSTSSFLPFDESNILSWVHFGDLHITHEEGQNYRDFLSLINEANLHLGKGGVNFAFLPGDNAENGTEAQYQLTSRAVAGLRIPLHAIPGDHDIQSGNLKSFRSHLCPEIPTGFKVGPYRCIFLNAVDSEGGKGFGFQREQLAWLAGELRNAILSAQRPLVFLHNYPSELGDSSGAFAEDVVTALSNQSGRYIPPSRFQGDDGNAIGAYPEKGILGTQLGPNKNGRPW
jgi:hypothetical protein